MRTTELVLAFTQRDTTNSQPKGHVVSQAEHSMNIKSNSTGSKTDNQLFLAKSLSVPADLNKLLKWHYLSPPWQSYDSNQCFSKDIERTTKRNK